MTRGTATYTCPSCRHKIRVLADEYGDHNCTCGWSPADENENETESDEE